MPQTTAIEEETVPASSTQESTRAEKISEVMETARSGIFLSPEGFIMMSTAMIVDILELFIPFEPFDPIDIFALIFFGAWMVFRAMLGGRKPEIRVPEKAKKAAAAVQKATKWAKRLKWLRPLLFILEMIPLVGAAPFWVVAVYLELKHG